MTDNQKKNLKIILLISILYFVIFIFPNSVGSSNSNMVLIFEPDEAVQLTPTLNMIRPRDSLYESAKRFFAYRHYFYGFPFFASSAMFLLPFRLTDNFEATQSIMLVLRQLISVAPMLLTIILWVYLQTKFKSRAHTILLFLFLLTIPAVTRNSFWWHPESLVLLFITGTFYFLEKDQFEFKKYFFWAAISCGFAIGTKLLGLFFFLTIPTYLVVGIFQKRISPREVIVLGSKFFGVMILSIIISNPLIIVPRVFQQYVQTQAFQANKMSFGWEVAYSSEPSSWFGLINNYYAPWHIIILSFIGIIYGIYKNKNRFLNINILTWVLPFTIYFLYFIVVKPTHYLLPIAIPLFSSILNFWPDKNYKENTRDNLMRKIMIYVIFLSVIFQIILNFQSGIITYSDKLTREESSDSIQFFQYVNENYLGELQLLNSIKIYHDPRLYVPNIKPWVPRASFKMLSYDYFEEYDPDVILLMRQRILDYTLEDLVPEDPFEYEKNFVFYTDAENGDIEGYYLIYENEFGLAFVRIDNYQKYFGK